MDKEVVLAILAKDKEYCLPFYLTCLLNLEYPKDKIHLWIRTNDNRDTTANILTHWVAQFGQEYASCVLNSEDIDKRLTGYEEHEWNAHRFHILGQLRQESINYAIELGADYFVVDCDNFIEPHVLRECSALSHLGVVGPMLRLSKEHFYANYHNIACPLGYYQENPDYMDILYLKHKGLISVDTIHCTYYLRNDLLPEVTYNDGSGRYEYAIFSDNLRKKNIPQYVDNRAFHGFLFLNDQIDLPFEKFIQHYWKEEYERSITRYR